MQFTQLFITQSLLLHPLCLMAYGFVIGISSYFFPLVACTIPLLIFALRNHQKFMLTVLAISALCGYGRTVFIANKHAQAVQQLSALVHDLTLNITNIERTDRQHCAWLIEATIDNNEPKLHGYAIRIYTNNKPNFYVGDTVCIKQCATKPNNSESFNRYMMRNNLIASYFMPQLSYTHMYTPAWSLARIIHATKINLIRSIRSKMTPRTYQLFCSIFLGKKASRSASRTKQQHKQWGTSHYLARSGLHMMIFIIIWKLLLSMLPIPWTVQHGLLGCIALIYATLSWGSISFYRALALLMVLQITTILQRSTSPMLHVMLITLGALILNPFHLAFLDFQLSFGLTLALALIHATFSYKRSISPKSLAF